MVGRSQTGTELDDVVVSVFEVIEPLCSLSVKGIELRRIQVGTHDERCAGRALLIFCVVIL